MVVFLLNCPPTEILTLHYLQTSNMFKVDVILIIRFDRGFYYVEKSLYFVNQGEHVFSILFPPNNTTLQQLW